jgi:hypothetical protein
MLMLRCFFGLFRVLKLALVDWASCMAYVPNVSSMPGLCCFHGCFYGLDNVVLLWFELSVLVFIICLC